MFAQQAFWISLVPLGVVQVSAKSPNVVWKRQIVKILNAHQALLIVLGLLDVRLQHVLHKNVVIRRLRARASSVRMAGGTFLVRLCVVQKHAPQSNAVK